MADLVNAADGTVMASYEYGPFGEAIRSTGPLAKNNPLRFSTKYKDDESDLVYYGFRYFKPSTGAWVSRDPSEEAGGLNVYLYSFNSPIQTFDILGLSPTTVVIWLQTTDPTYPYDRRLFEKYLLPFTYVHRDLFFYVLYQPIPPGRHGGWQPEAEPGSCHPIYFVDLRASTTLIDTVVGGTTDIASGSSLVGWTNPNLVRGVSWGDNIFIKYPASSTFVMGKWG